MSVCKCTELALLYKLYMNGPNVYPPILIKTLIKMVGAGISPNQVCLMFELKSVFDWNIMPQREL